MPKTKTRKQLDHEIDQALKGSIGNADVDRMSRAHRALQGKLVTIEDAEIDQMFQARGSDGDSAKVAILGDPMYVRRFKMPKWNIKPSVLNDVSVAIRHHNELGIPTSKHAHRLRADYLRALRHRFEAEHQRLLDRAERAHGKSGTLLTAGMRESWPRAVKDRILFVAQGTSALSDAVRLHEALAKTRSPAFR